MFAVKRGYLKNKEIYCNSLYPFYISLMRAYSESPYYSGMMNEYLDINPRTEYGELEDESQVSFVPMTNVQEKNNVVTYDMVPYGKVKKGFTVFRKGDLIWAKITPCMQNGKSCVVQDMPTEIGYGSTEFHVIRKRSDQIYMPFIWSIFTNDNVLKAAQAVFSGSAGQQRVSASFLENFPAVVPPYDIQVALVSDLEKKIVSMNERLCQADELLNGMSRYIHEALNITVQNFESRLCGAVRLRDIMQKPNLSAGYYHPERMAAINSLKDNPNFTLKKLYHMVEFCRNIVDSASSPETYLGLAGVESQSGELSGVEEAAAGQAFSYQAGDVLYGRLRPYLNKVLLAESSGICSTEFHVMRVVNQKELLPEYLAAVMRSDLIVAQTRHMMTGNTHPRISNEDVKNLYIPVPDISIQEKIAKELNRRRAEARKLKAVAEQEWLAAKKRFEKELLGDLI